MRSRHSVYFFRLVDHLVSTTHPDIREPSLQPRLYETAHEANWRFLTALGSSKWGADDKVGKVKFIAKFLQNDQLRQLHEHSRFKRSTSAWSANDYHRQQMKNH